MLEELDLFRSSLMESAVRVGGGGYGANWKQARESFGGYYFQMPLHYPSYSKAEYETMPEWELDRLLSQYGLPMTGSLEQKREFAVGAFLWHH